MAGIKLGYFQSLVYHADIKTTIPMAYYTYVLWSGHDFKISRRVIFRMSRI